MATGFIIRQVAIFGLTFIFLTNSINWQCAVQFSDTESYTSYNDILLEKKDTSLRIDSKGKNSLVGVKTSTKVTLDKDVSLLEYYDPSTANLKTTKSLHDNIAKSCRYKSGQGNEGKGGYKVLQKVRQGLLEHQEQSSTNKPKPKILCMVYSHSENEEQIEAIVNTWGQKCDGFFTSSDVENRELGILNLESKGDESYGNMWQKTRKLLMYAYKNYKDSYDYFHVCGDDVYLVVDHLRSFVSGPQVQRLLDGTQPIGFHTKLEKKGWDFEQFPDRPLLLGQAVPDRIFAFPGGGPGYTLNRAALERFGKVCYPEYLPHGTDPREDLMVASCFADPHLASRGNPQFYTSNTMDEKGAIRYHLESAEFQANLKNIHATPWRAKELKKKFGYTTLKGVKGASKTSISFHLKDVCERNVIPESRCEKESITSIKAGTIYRYHSILFDACP